MEPETYAQMVERVRAAYRQLAALREDAARLDWLDNQSGGDPWIARQSTMGRGYRLHNGEGGAATVREAIDRAREEDKP